MLTTGPASGSGSQAVATAAYTAFGERVGGAGSGSLGTRYQYVGEYGYEADVLYGAHAPLNGPNTNLDAIVLLHVGARWHDPAIGRFVQRDPSGVLEGINVYEYVRSQPIIRIDPNGQGLIEFAYTGQWNPSQAVYDAAVDGAAAYLCWVKQPS